MTGQPGHGPGGALLASCLARVPRPSRLPPAPGHGAGRPRRLSLLAAAQALHLRAILPQPLETKGGRIATTIANENDGDE